MLPAFVNNFLGEKKFGKFTHGKNLEYTKGIWIHS